MKIKAHTSFIGNTGYNSHSRNFFTHLDKLIPIKVRNFTTGENWVEYTVTDPVSHKSFKSVCIKMGDNKYQFKNSETGKVRNAYKC